MNAKEELLNLLIVYKVNLRCAAIKYMGKHLKLCDGYTEEQYAGFLRSLDFEYDNGFGGQLVYGTLWFKAGTWATRGEYDGSEWWEHHRWPEIPDYLKG